MQNNINEFFDFIREESMKSWEAALNEEWKLETTSCRQGNDNVVRLKHGTADTLKTKIIKRKGR